MCQTPNEDRAIAAKEETWPTLMSELLSQQIRPESSQIYLRCFKYEEILEVWTKDSAHKAFKLFRTYQFCTNSGILGPKLNEGDKQIPEGVYYINRFNPKSKFHLSLGLDYPNKSDLLFADKTSPGSDIFIHGKCSSIGCVAIGDEAIKELYTLASNSIQNQASIRVDIFPYRFSTNVKIDEQLKSTNQPLWDNLRTVFSDFENTKMMTPIRISDSGKYIVES